MRRVINHETALFMTTTMTRRVHRSSKARRKDQTVCSSGKCIEHYVNNTRFCKGPISGFKTRFLLTFCSLSQMFFLHKIFILFVKTFVQNLKIYILLKYVSLQSLPETKLGNILRALIDG